MDRVLMAALLVATLSSQIQAQAFPNDNDGLLDVGEAPGFPANPAAITWPLSLHSRYIEDLDGTKLLTNLSVLELGNNRIVSIEQGDFDGLINLQRLNLARNSITSIDQGDFEGLSNLHRLEMEYNKLTSIEPGDFDGLTSLPGLILRSGRKQHQQPRAGRLCGSYQPAYPLSGQ